MAKELVHDESLLDLLTKQQTRGESGVRLSFHPDLLSPMSFFLHPLHYAAVTGNTALACYLYSKNITGKNVTVASFAAGGRNGQTSWRIPVTMSPSQTASLAGHAITAKALKYLESGIPLEWDRKQHSHFKVNDFKLKSRKLMKSLLESVWFYNMPGPARIRITDTLMKDLARIHVWGFIDARILDGDWENLLGPEIFQAIESLRSSTDYSSRPRTHQFAPQYQFSIGQVNHQVRRRRYVREAFRFLRRGVVGGVMWLLTRRRKGCPSLMFAAGIYVAAGYCDVLNMVLPIILHLFHDP